MFRWEEGGVRWTVGSGYVMTAGLMWLCASIVAVCSTFFKTAFHFQAVIPLCIIQTGLYDEPLLGDSDASVAVFKVKATLVIRCCCYKDGSAPRLLPLPSSDCVQLSLGGFYWKWRCSDAPPLPICVLLILPFGNAGSFAFTYFLLAP